MTIIPVKPSKVGEGKRLGGFWCVRRCPFCILLIYSVSTFPMNGKHRYYRYAATENLTILSVHHRYIIGMHRSTNVFWLTVCSRLHTDGVPMAFHRFSSVRSCSCTDSTDGFGWFGIGSLSARCPQTTSNDLIGPQTTRSRPTTSALHPPL